MNGSIFAFVFTMWILILLGGGLLVLFIGPTSFEAIYDIEPLLNSGLKDLIALIFAFIFTMWILILVGGGLLVLFIGPISFVGTTDINPMLNSIIKVIIALILIFFWVLILTKIKNWIFQKQIKS